MQGVTKMKYSKTMVYWIGVGAAAGLLAGGSSYAQKANSDPTPRTFMTPQSASKIRVFEAKQWRMFGIEPDNLATSKTQVGASGTAKSCSTNIGPSAASLSNNNSGRYGPGQATQDSTVIVTGDVISVCK
jgi:hypothetical protein